MVNTRSRIHKRLLLIKSPVRYSISARRVPILTVPSKSVLSSSAAYRGRLYHGAVASATLASTNLWAFSSPVSCLTLSTRVTRSTSTTSLSVSVDTPDEDSSTGGSREACWTGISALFGTGPAPGVMNMGLRMFVEGDKALEGEKAVAVSPRRPRK
jgi:hypothetical protein